VAFATRVTGRHFEIDISKVKVTRVYDLRLCPRHWPSLLSTAQLGGRRRHWSVTLCSAERYDMLVPRTRTQFGPCIVFTLQLCSRLELTSDMLHSAFIFVDNSEMGLKPTSSHEPTHDSLITFYLLTYLLTYDAQAQNPP